ncbi:MAG: FAD:protein FMN transferase [Bacteroidales bacterium]|nr:FAD:protein FMN transferase [Bacteroidales bacterium]
MIRTIGVACFVLLCIAAYPNELFKQKAFLMGSDFEITVTATNEAQADIFIALAIDEIKRIEKLISSWDSNSQTTRINKHAGIAPVIVDEELFELIQRSKGLSKLTDGAFDISYASMDNIWHFDGKLAKIPASEQIANAVKYIGHQNILLDATDGSVLLKHKGMKIGFGAIGKGYAADKAKELLISKGVSAGIINASGDLNTWGKRPDGKDWTVAVTNPLDKNKAFATLTVSNKAVVTSGNYEKFIMLEGKCYSHIIDPRTGYPTQGIISVTVYAPKAELADALATSVFVMGIEAGLHRINQLPGVECLIIDSDGNIHTSDSIKINRL